MLYLIEREQDPIEWADMAAESGYFDQAHFIHDFQTFSGFSPEAYLKQKRESDVIRSEEACRRDLNDDLQEHVYGLNAHGYPAVCRRSLNKDFLQHPVRQRRVTLFR
jgi:hypothetical protein